MSQHSKLALCLCANPMHVVVSSGNACKVNYICVYMHVSNFCLYELTEANTVVCWVPPNPQDIEDIEWMIDYSFVKKVKHEMA